MNNIKKAVHEFLFAVRCAIQFEHLTTLTDSFRNLLHLPQEELDNEECTSSAELYNSFVSSGEKMYSNYLDSTYTNVYVALVENLCSPTKAKKLTGISLSLTIDDIKSLSPKIYAELFSYFENAGTVIKTPDEDMTIFIEILRSLFNNKNTETNSEHLVCPYCGGQPDIVEASDFFGDDTKYDGQRICCCDCGAYARLTKDDALIGTLAPKDLHNKRNCLRSLAFEFSKATGFTKYETNIRMLKKVNKYLKNYQNAIDYFNDEECNVLIDALANSLKQLQEISKTISYPRTPIELMDFLRNDMRLRVVKEITGKYNNKFIRPVAVGDTCIVISNRDNTETMQFPNIPDMYHFDGNTFEIWHPSGAKDEYIMYPSDLRQLNL